MTAPAVTIVGGEAAMADIRRWADQVAPAVARAANPFASRFADTVRARVPVLTGQLAGSIETNETDDGAEIGYDGSAPYDGWIEFGGSRGRPYIDDGRYLFPSAADAQDEFLQLASDTAGDTAGRFSWSTPST